MVTHRGVGGWCAGEAVHAGQGSRRRHHHDAARYRWLARGWVRRAFVRAGMPRGPAGPASSRQSSAPWPCSGSTGCCCGAVTPPPVVVPLNRDPDRHARGSRAAWDRSVAAGSRRGGFWPPLPRRGRGDGSHHHPTISLVFSASFRGAGGRFGLECAPTGAPTGEAYRRQKPELLPQGGRLPVGVSGAHQCAGVHPADRAGAVHRRVPAQPRQQRVPGHSRAHLRSALRAGLPAHAHRREAGRNLPAQARRRRSARRRQRAASRRFPPRRTASASPASARGPRRWRWPTISRRSATRW